MLGLKRGIADGQAQAPGEDEELGGGGFVVVLLASPSNSHSIGHIHICQQCCPMCVSHESLTDRGGNKEERWVRHRLPESPHLEVFPIRNVDLGQRW